VRDREALPDFALLNVGVGGGGLPSFPPQSRAKDSGSFLLNLIELIV
jgi:hypothetical protein